MIPRLRYSVDVARRSTNELANASTAVVSLVAVPFLSAALIVAVGFAAGSQALVLATQAALLASITSSMIGLVGGQTAMDRFRGVTSDVRPFGLLHPALWIGKAIVAFTSATMSALVVVVVLGLTGNLSRDMLMLALLMPGVALPVSIGFALLSFLFRDPLSLVNALIWVIPVTAGTVVSVTAYPEPFSSAVLVLPATWVVRALRGEVSLTTGVLTELGVGVAWCLAGVLLIRLAEYRYRRGAVDRLPG